MSFMGKATVAVAALGMAAGSVFGAGTANAAGDLYGAIALGDGWDDFGGGINFSTRADAEAKALELCAADTCTIRASWSNGCLTIVENDEYTAWGVGSTRAESEKDAWANLVEGSPQALLLNVGSSQLAGQLAGGEVVAVHCTDNVR
ncbi:DUF4189 domain-containing protein [Nocardia camponoti]|uniref:DUF4189 domain-containing protein n=1 Tax=Nocardia camponoti TaxID=1616106 RepID=A0A917QAC3_9NOCA|nr:DUF4189 domain-containing protein [Nocardia camponoti]GGK38849.1 hypothetical protein GCM10011591_08210 [Nocardia camponoti]